MKRLLFIISLSICAALYAQPKVKLETIFTINDDKTTKKEYMFKDVAGIITDDENNFYVHQYFGTEIRKFSKDGKYIKTIGRSGEGPGEIKQIQFLYLTGKNELLVYDQINARDTYFDLNGRYLRSFPSKYSDHPYQKLLKYDNSSYITLKSVNENVLKHGNKIIICDEKSHKMITSFGHSSIFWKYNDVCEKFMDKANKLNMSVTESKIYVTKEFYDGKIYIFNKNENWGVKAIEGNQIKKPSYEVIERQSSNEIFQNDYPGGNVSFGEEWGGKKRLFTINYRYVSIGLFVYKEKYLLNFLTKTIKKKEYEFGVDVYSLDGVYLGYSMIEKSNKFYLSDKVLCKDKEEDFYLRTNKVEIRKIKLTIE